MRVLLTTPSSDARLHNLVPLGWALRTDGHAVQVAARSRFAGTINRTGLVAIDAGGDADDGWLAGPGAVDAVADYAGLWDPDMVIWDQRAPAGAVAARVTGAVSVRMRGFPDRLSTPDADDAEVGRRLGDSLARHGLTLDGALVSGDVTIDSVPPSTRDSSSTSGLSVRSIPYDGPGIVPAWLRRRPRRTRVLVTLAGPASIELFDAVGRLDIEVICAVTPDRIPDGTVLPDNVRLLDAVPLNAVVPTCSAVVHDGSATAVAASNGVPQLLLPAGAAGAGALRDRIHRLITDPLLRREAERLRDEVWSMPSPSDVVPELTKLVLNIREGGRS